jgi:hypothetical protein
MRKIITKLIRRPKPKSKPAAVVSRGTKKCGGCGGRKKM